MTWVRRPARVVLLAWAVSLAAPLALAPVSTAMAAWSATGSGSGAGAATAMPTGVTPSGSAAGDDVTVTWSAADMADGTAVAGYTVSRTNVSTETTVAAGGTCSGVVTQTTCTDSPVPAGDWVYQDTPVERNWTGGQSPASATIVVP
jgi:hypothetical protein